MIYNVKKQAACYLLVLLHEGYLILPSSQSMYHKHKYACLKSVFIIIFFWHYQTGLSSHKRGVTPPSSGTLSSVESWEFWPGKCWPGDSAPKGVSGTAPSREAPRLAYARVSSGAPQHLQYGILSKWNEKPERLYL